MFEGRRRGALRRAMGGSDPTVENLLEKIAARQERIAALELELFDIRASLEVFRVERERRLSPYLTRIARLEKEIETARRQADYHATWKGREDAPDFYTTPAEQFRKAWTSTGRRAKFSGAVRQPPPVDMEELRRLYRSLAKRFHPDLTTDPAEKIQRQEKMAKINQAYMEQNQEQLLVLADEPYRPGVPQELSREHQVLGLYEEINRLDELILQLQNQLNELNSSDDLHLALEFSLAQHEGRDLLGEYAAYYEGQIRTLEQELSKYTKR
ncbi:MAG: hypothetical protein JXA25_16020 [Anaerolineales bacterium]|nr:hypothetical protein [Anaerolineales bacterium]